jgi:hypothetical protein
MRRTRAARAATPVFAEYRERWQVIESIIRVRSRLYSSFRFGWSTHFGAGARVLLKSPLPDDLHGNPWALRAKRKICRENAINLHGPDLQLQPGWHSCHSISRPSSSAPVAA